MRLFAIALFCLSTSIHAQTTHFVEMGGSTIGSTQPYYSPSVLVIDAGDIVRWTNVSGTHNVNGRLFNFPGNPEEFYSGPPDNGTWSYQFTFTVPGEYDYHCDSQGHSATQFGSITVLGGNSIGESEALEAVRVYPQPATDVLMVEVGPRIITQVEVLSIDGRTIAIHPNSSGTPLGVPVSDLPAGNYIVRLIGDSGAVNVPFSKL
jgi:plastocyanin